MRWPDGRADKILCRDIDIVGVPQWRDGLFRTSSCARLLILIWVCSDSLGYLTASFYRLWDIFATHPDLVIIFKALSDNVEVPLEVVPFLLPQLFPCKRLDGVV